MNEVLLQLLDYEKEASTVHPDFRLWITTEVHEEFPISLLQMCIKFTNEAPSGKYVQGGSSFVYKMITTIPQIIRDRKTQ